MIYEVIITDQANVDLRGIYEYITFELLSPDNAAGQLDSNAGPYDQGCNETLQSCFKDYFDGTVDLETAKKNFEDQIKVKYPELSSVEWPA